jgi:hypothetical protein
LIFSIKPRHRSDLVSSKGKYKNEGYPTPPSGQSTGCGLRTRRRINCTEHFQIALLLYIALDFSISAIHWTFLVFIIVIHRPPPPLPIIYGLLLSPMMTTNFTPFKKKSREKV